VGVRGYLTCAESLMGSLGFVETGVRLDSRAFTKALAVVRRNL